MADTKGKLNQLQQIVGIENASDDDFMRVAYSRDQHWTFTKPKMPAFIVRPANATEVSQILLLANEAQIPVVTRSTGINIRGYCIPEKEGSIVLDLGRMNHILEINPVMWTATVEPGVTYVQLMDATKKVGFRPCFPDAPATVSVVANNLLRPIVQSAARDGIDHILSMEIVLPNGEILRTGSSALETAGPYFRYGFTFDAGSLFVGGPGIYGVVTKMTIKLYPLHVAQKLFTYSFPKFENAVAPIREIMQKELITALRLHSTAIVLKVAFNIKKLDLTKFPEVVLYGVCEDHVRERFDVHVKLIQEILDKTSGIPMNTQPSDIQGTINDLLGARGTIKAFKIKGNLYCLGYYIALEKTIPAFRDLLSLGAKHGFAADDVCIYLSPIARFHGQACYVEDEIFFDSTDPSQGDRLLQFHEERVKTLLDLGIYGWFRPYAGAVKATFDRLGNFIPFWKNVYELIDPKHIMNPNKVF